MANQPAIVLTTSSAKTSSGFSSSFPVPVGALKLAVLADVTAVSGTSPSMTLEVRWTQEGSATATADPADTFTAITAAGVKVKSFDVKGTNCVLIWTITGTTPSFTFSAKAHGV